MLSANLVDCPCELLGFGATDGCVAMYDFIGFGTMDCNLHYVLLGFGAVEDNCLYEFIRFGVMDCNLLYKFIGFGALRNHRNP